MAQQNILIIKLGSFGDIVMAEGVMRGLRAAHARDHITLLTEPFYARFLKDAPHFDAIITDDRPPRWQLHRLYQTRRNLKAHRFDLVYDLQNSRRSHLYHRWLAPAKISSCFSDSTFYFDRNAALRENPHRAVHDLLAAQIRKADVEIVPEIGEDVGGDIAPDLRWAAADAADIIPLLEEAGIEPENKGGFVLLVVGSSQHNKERRWPYYPELIEALAAQNIACATAPGPDEMEHCHALAAPMILDKGAPLTFSQLIALAPHCRYVVGNDTGPTHLMAGAGTKGLALFKNSSAAICAAHAARTGIDKTYDVITCDDFKKVRVGEVMDYVKAGWGAE